MASNKCMSKDWDGLKQFKPGRMKYQPLPYYKPTTTTTTPPPTKAPTPAPVYPPPHQPYGGGNGLGNLLSYSGGHNYQPLLVLLVPVPNAYPQHSYATTTTTTTAAPTTTEAYTTEEYGYEPIGSY